MELISILNRARVSPAIDTSTFPSTPSAFFWSSSDYMGTGDDAWHVDFDTG